MGIVFGSGAEYDLFSRNILKANYFPEIFVIEIFSRKFEISRQKKLVEILT